MSIADNVMGLTDMVAPVARQQTSPSGWAGLPTWRAQRGSSWPALMGGGVVTRETK